MRFGVKRELQGVAVRRTLAAVFAAAACCLASAADVELFVSTRGDDAWPGTKEKPFATAQRAVRAVRELKSSGPAPAPVTVYFRDGVYALSEPLRFGPDDTGTEQAPVTYASHPGERAVISGGRRIAGPWRRAPGGAYFETSIPEVRDGTWQFNCLIVNGMSRTRARTPNWGEKVFRAEGRAPGEDERQAFAYFAGDIDPTWTNLTDADIVLLCSWTPTIHRIEEVLAERRIVKFASSHSRAVDAWEKNFRYYVSNVFEALDTPGEWYLNRRTGMLYYYPLPGEDMASVEVIAPVLKTRLMTFSGDVDSGRFVEHLTFRDLGFKHVDGDLDRYNGVYRQGHMFLSAAIYAVGLRSSVFSNCEIAHVGEYALELEAGCQENRIEHCHIWDTGAGAMQIGITDLRTALSGRAQVRPGDIVLEAEDAEVTAPMVVERDEAASNGQYTVLPDGSEAGMVTFTFDVKEPGPYRMIARVIARDGTSDSFSVQVNDGQRYTYDTGNGGRWFMSAVVARELGGKPVRAELKAGSNTVVFTGRESSTKLDQLIVRRCADVPAPEQEYAETAVLANVIDNNFIHRLGTIWHGCYGVVNRFASLTRITHNEITDTHWDAIGLDARWNYNGEKHSHGNVVAYNHLHHLGLGYHTDAGGVYQFGPLDTHIHHNLIHDTRAYPYICGYAGIYLDEQSRNALVENNLVYNVEWFAYFQHKGMDNTFRNNIGAFARDGLILRGGLNKNWPANYMEAYRNIYISRDEVGIKRAWQPGDKPPVLRENMYFSLATGTDMTFAGKSLTDWQAEGQDKDSVVGDPGCRDPGNYDFSLRPDAAAPEALGFAPLDDEIRKAGLYGDAAWVNLPKRYAGRTPTAVWEAEDMVKLVSFDLDFEGMPDGYEPTVFKLAKEGDATFAVTSEAACAGTRSYKCTDRKGLRKPFYPYIHVAPRGLDKGTVLFAFSVLNSKDAPVRFYAEMRGKGSTSDIGPSLHFGRDGTLVANGTTVLVAAPGTWLGIEIRLQLGDTAPKEYTLVTRLNGAETTQVIPFTHETFSEIRWLGISAADDADGVFYLDNLRLKLE